MLAKLDFSAKRLAGARALRLSLRGLGCADCSALAACLAGSGALPRLTALDLSSNQIGGDGKAHFIFHCSTTTTLLNYFYTTPTPTARLFDYSTTRLLDYSTSRPLD